jgi:hypothetical protein
MTMVFTVSLSSMNLVFVPTPVLNPAGFQDSPRCMSTKHCSATFVHTLLQELKTQFRLKHLQHTQNNHIQPTKLKSLTKSNNKMPSYRDNRSSSSTSSKSRSSSNQNPLRKHIRTSKAPIPWTGLRCPKCRAEDPTYHADVGYLNLHMLTYHAYDD